MPNLSFPKLDSARDAAFAQQDEIDLGNVLRILWRRKLLILGVAGVLMIAGCLAVFSVTPKYTAEALVAVGVQSPNLSLLYSGSATASPGVDVDVVATETEVLSARSIARRVIEQLDLGHDPEFAASDVTPAAQPSLIARLTQHGNNNPANELTDVERKEARLVDDFVQRLKVAAKGTSKVIVVNFTAKDPALAAKAANTLVQTYVGDQVAAKKAALAEADNWIQRRIAELRDTAVAAAAKRDAYARQFGPFPEPGSAVSDEKQLGDAVSRLEQAQSDVASLRARLARMKALAASGAGTETMPEGVGSALMQGLQNQASELQTQIAEMSLRLGSSSGQLRAAQAGLVDLRRKMKIEAGRELQQLSNEASIAADKQAAQAELVRNLRDQIPRIEQARATYKALEQEAADSRAALETLVAREKAYGRGADGTATEASSRIVSLADAPTVPSSPKTGLMLVLVSVLAISASAVVTFVAEAMDRRRLRSGDDIEAKMGLPVLGLVPVTGRKRAFDVFRGQGEAAAQPTLAWSEVPLRPFSEYSEAIRRCHNMLSLTSGDASSNIVLVTSAQPQEGKTTFAISFACSAALSGRRVLLIDADGHKPDVASNLGLQTAVGLTDLLTGKADLEEAVLASEIPGLSVIVGTPSDRPLTSPLIARLGSLLPMLQRRYDLIVIDTAPVLAASETLLLSRLADATMFVVRWADTSGATARVALKQIEMAGVEVRGAVLTMVDPSKHARYGFKDGVYYSKRLRDYGRRSKLVEDTSPNQVEVSL